MMKIGQSDGSIRFASGSIQPNQNRMGFLDTRLGSMSREEIVNAAEDWRHVAVQPEPGIAATLIYQGERLHQVFIAFAIPSDGTDEWTVQNELERKAKHDEWLRNELGNPPYDYAWGRVDSEFDSKGCASEIIITYAI